MNTTETNSAANKAPSAGDSQFLQSTLMRIAQAQGENAASGPPALAATPTLSGLLHALRRRWLLALGIAVAATAAAVLAVFLLLPPKYNVTMRLRVVAKQGGPEDVEFPIFKANMEAMVRNPLVLNNALNDKTADGRDIHELPFVRGMGMAAVESLEKNLKTDYLLGPEVLRVTLAADQPEEAAELLNAIARAFFNEYAEMERSKKQQRLEELRKQKERIEEDLRKLRGILASIYSSLDIKDQQAATIQQQQWLEKLRNAEATRRVIDDEIAKSEGKIFTSKARLKNLDKQPIPDGVLYDLFSRDPSIRGFDKRIGEIEKDIADYYQKYNEPYASQYATPLKREKIKIKTLKEEREASLKPALEKRWRETVRAELEYQIGTAELDIQDCTLRRERVAKEIREYEQHVKESGPGGANKPAQILATEEKIDGAKRALELTGQKISDVELELPAARIIPIQKAAPPLSRDRTQQTKIAGACLSFLSSLPAGRPKSALPRERPRRASNCGASGLPPFARACSSARA
jgi:uncharacterized protein involved in exopolysaccharide biosynthesis